MKYLLIVLVSASSCQISNIDHAEPAVTVFQDQAECEKMASAIDSEQNIRAVCLEVSP